ncbi:MAG: TIGR00282 family metallophosphoesterase [Planctomycetes bacterium]|nr:TIGR00282 family metallophosphoesterase [Planctomycetota bacterium]
MRVLLIGDIVGKPGREIVSRVLPDFIAEKNLHFVLANAENAAQGSGITPSLYKELVRAGVDVVTLGDHTWRRKEALPLLKKESRILRPLNYPPECVGKGMEIYEARQGFHIAVITLLGRIFMNPVDCPFRCVDQALLRLNESIKVIFVEIHAEATSEKMAMGWKLDGRVSCVFGTHTHVPTADGRVLPCGTAYITDLGMTGPYDSVIGRTKESVLFKFETSMHAPFMVASGDVRLCGALVRLESETGKALEIERVELR